jgi:hypothetical protein
MHDRQPHDLPSRRRGHRLAGLVALALTCAAGSVCAATCTADDFAAAVDRSGASLRAFNAEAMPKLQDKLKQLKARKGWNDADYEEKGMNSLRDERSAQLDSEAEGLILQIDELGRPPTGAPLDCGKLTELDDTGQKLLQVMKAKSDYTLAKLDAQLAEAPAPAAPAPPPSPPAHGTEAKANNPAPKIPPPQRKPAPKWSTETRAEEPPPPPPPPIAALAPPADEPEQKGYTIDEIRDITRGFFGTISTELGSVLEYAFSTSGRPDGYVLGTEGGGAFLAGVRYGSGTLYLRSGGTQKVYWHGPSIGTDLGAAGSRTMFLIYHLQDAADLMRGFTGIDGSAYFVGGVGITFLKGGRVLMAPIRSGLGFRLGANLGYIRFTPRPTWNPF